MTYKEKSYNIHKASKDIHKYIEQMQSDISEKFRAIQKEHDEDRLARKVAKCEVLVNAKQGLDELIQKTCKRYNVNQPYLIKILDIDDKFALLGNSGESFIFDQQQEEL